MQPCQYCILHWPWGHPQCFLHDLVLTTWEEERGSLRPASLPKPFLAVCCADTAHDRSHTGWQLTIELLLG